MRDRQTCVGCGKKSPETETNYTLISAQFGWRLTRYKNPDGTLVVEWRCPACWREYKRARNSAPGPEGPPSSGTQRATPLVRTPLPGPQTPMESFRPRAPSSSGELPHVRSPIPPPAPPPPLATRPTPPRPSTPARPSTAPPRATPAQPTPSTIPTDRPRRPPVR